MMKWSNDYITSWGASIMLDYVSAPSLNIAEALTLANSSTKIRSNRIVSEQVDIANKSKTFVYEFNVTADTIVNSYGLSNATGTILWHTYGKVADFLLKKGIHYIPYTMKQKAFMKASYSPPNYRTLEYDMNRFGGPAARPFVHQINIFNQFEFEKLNALGKTFSILEGKSIIFYTRGVFSNAQLDITTLEKDEFVVENKVTGLIPTKVTPSPYGDDKYIRSAGDLQEFRRTRAYKLELPESLNISEVMAFLLPTTFGDILITMGDDVHIIKTKNRTISFTFPISVNYYKPKQS